MSVALFIISILSIFLLIWLIPVTLINALHGHRVGMGNFMLISTCVVALLVIYGWVPTP